MSKSASVFQQKPKKAIAPTNIPIQYKICALPIIISAMPVLVFENHRFDKAIPITSIAATVANSEKGDDNCPAHSMSRMTMKKRKSWKYKMFVIVVLHRLFLLATRKY